MTENKLLLIGCGILKNEIRWLIKDNNWKLDTVFLDSSLHVNFEELSKQLKETLSKYVDRDIIVFYGTCHPLMETILGQEKTFRTPEQNCVAMILGNELFTNELANGAYFLLEDWALRWNEIVTKTFGENPDIVQKIFRIDRKYLLAIRTPCSGDFKSEAESAGKIVGVPVRWIDVSLNNLERVLEKVIERKIKELECRI